MSRSWLTCVSFALAGLLAAGCGGGSSTPADAAPEDAPIDAPPVGPAALALSPLTADFGSVTVGETSPATRFTLSNTGASTSGAIAFAVAGDFHVLGTTCETLAPAATCTVDVAFRPTSTIAHTTLLTASTAGSTASASLSGTGSMPGNLGVSPPTYAFAGAILGTASTELDTITVRNTGTLASGMLTVQPTGSDPTQFTKTSDTCSGHALAAGATCTLGINFTPTTAGMKSAGFAILGNPGGTVTSTVTGTATAAAHLAAFPATLDFGSVVLGATSANATVSVANTGGVATGAITAAASGPFAIATTSCTTLAPQTSCTLVLRYAPTASGPQSGTLTISGTPGGTATVGLAGSGVTPGHLSIAPTTTAFPATQIGQTTAASSFTITNTGGQPAGPLGIQIAGTDAAQFHLGATTCAGATLATGATCTAAVTFAPTTVGAKTASLLVSGGGGISAALSGAGLPAPQLAIAPGVKDFGSVGLGTTSAAQAFTITNVGGAPTTIPTVSLGGTNPDQFLQTNNCTAALAPAASCTVSVQFQPTAVALDSAMLLVAAGTGGTVSASLFGQGQNPAQLVALPSSLTFTGTVGDVGPVQTFTITNNGAVTSGPISVAITSTGPNPFSQTSTCTTLAAAASCTVSVMYAPTATGTQAATATVTASPGGSPTVALSGTARARLEVVTIKGLAPVDPFDFGAHALGVTSTASIVLRNNSAASAAVTRTTTFPAPAQYALQNACTTIAAGQTCALDASFTPTSLGIKTGGIVFAMGAGAANQAAVNLTGTGQATIALTANTATSFGNIVLGQTSPPLVFTVTNQATVASGVISLNALTAPFAQQATTCGPSLAPGGTCTITIVFQPSTLGLSMTPLIATAATAGTATLDLSGTGVTSSNLALSPAPAAFGAVFAGTTKDLAIVVTNPAGAQTTGAMTFAFAGDATFTILNNGTAGDCVNGVTALPNGQTCAVRLRYAPLVFDAAGTHTNTGTLTVTANPGAVAGITSAVSGIATSTISISPTPFDFGTKFVGQPAATQVFTVHNDSLASVTLGTAALTGTTTNLAITADTCSTHALAASATCTMTVTFTPTVEATTLASLDIATTNGFGRAIASVAAKSGNLLYSQLDGFADAAFVSEIVTTDPTITALGADDFVVPASGWTVSQVVVYWFLSDAASTFNVTFYADAGGLPGAQVATRTGLAYTQPNGAVTFDYANLALTFAPVVLPAGTYWLAVQGVSATDLNYWAVRSVQAGSAAVIREAGGFGSGCTTFANREGCFDPSGPDNMFELRGTAP